MAEFLYWKIGETTELVMNEQAYLDFKHDQKTSQSMISDYMSLIRGREPEKRATIHGFIGLHKKDEEQNISRVFLNAVTLKVAMSMGVAGACKETDIITSFSALPFSSIENAGQIIKAGSCEHLDAPDEQSLSARNPYVYEFPMATIKADIKGQGLSEIFTDQIASITDDALTILPEGTYCGADINEYDLVYGRCALSQQKMSHSQMSYIYPSVV